MAMRCENCSKGIMYGHNVSHSKRRTRRIFKPNLHKAKIVVGGISKRMKLCSKCLRIIKGKSTRDAKIKEKIFENIAQSSQKIVPAAV